MGNTIRITSTIFRHTVFYSDPNDYRTRTNGSSRNRTFPSHSIQRHIFLYVRYLCISFVSAQQLPTHTQGWKNIKKLADEWGFPHIWLQAEEKLQEIDFFTYAPHQRLMRLPVQTRLIAEQTYIRWKIRHQPWDYESVKDDSP